MTVVGEEHTSSKTGGFTWTDLGPRNPHSVLYPGLSVYALLKSSSKPTRLCPLKTPYPFIPQKCLEHHHTYTKHGARV